MYKTITAENIIEDKLTQNFSIEIPNSCPHCSTGISAVFIDAYSHERSPGSNIFDLYALFFCPKCERAFVAYYCGSPFFEMSVYEIYPAPSDTKCFSENISDLSPDFVEIYNQSFLAEQEGLTEICGMGYRKALEFLIKDYAIKSNPENEEEIKRKPLSQCINTYIENQRIQTLATASAWLGNDETHYCRKHEDYNINSLKAFINAIVSYINSELEVIKANELVNQ